MRQIQRVGRFYAGNIMKHIGILLFIGLVSVVFHEDGWFPNREMYEISQQVYVYILPCLLAYDGGKSIGNVQGGILAVLGTCGVISSCAQAGILGAMLWGPLGGYVWKQVKPLWEDKIPSELQMLFTNLMLAIGGAVLAGCGYYFVAPFLQGLTEILFQGFTILMKYKMTGVFSILIEPAKVFFFNNLLNHGILVPLGMNQVQEMGSSVFFLLESNPGPGLGVLLALYLSRKKEKNECFSAIFAEAIGGVHEVYFPFVLANMKLLIPLILGGMAGSYWFDSMECGLQGAVSPGSVFIILLMSGKQMGKVFVGIALSCIVSLIGSMILLREKNRKPEEKTQERLKLDGVKKIGFVCDGGMGSSAMGAALFRRLLQEKQIIGIEVKAYASDMIPDELDLIVCQKDFYQMRGDWKKEPPVYVVDSFVNRDGYLELAEKLCR